MSKSMAVSSEIENWANLAEFPLTRDAEDGQAIFSGTAGAKFGTSSERSLTGG